MTLSAGARLGPYEILAPIGKGGMGEVYRARDTRLHRDVAIKVSAAKFSERFEREARAVAALNHPNICTLHDVGADYLVMELVDGKPLEGPLPLADALRLAAQICDALDHAHRKGVVHRDLKPANILLTKQGIKLLDFGLARVTSGPETPTLNDLTHVGTVMGTPAYMAPEQSEGKAADARSDIFAFGCVLYEMLTGRRATHERKPLESAALESVVKACLERDPDDRWQSAADVKRGLALAVPVQTNAGRRSGASVAWIAGAGALVLVAFGSWTVLRLTPPATDNTQATRSQIALPENGTIAAGNSNTLAVSPDGRMTAFVVEVNQKPGVWIQELQGTSARRLPGSDGAQFVLWSPDSKSVAFRVLNQLFRFDLASSAPVVIATMPVGPTFGADWGDDGTSAGTILFWGGTGLMRVSGTGGTPVAIGITGANFPRLLPGGRFSYTSNQRAAVFGAPLDHPDQAVEILKENVAPIYAPQAGGAANGGTGHLLWIRGTTLLAQEFDPRTLKLAGEPRVIADPAWTVAGSSRLLLYDPAPAMSQFGWVDRSGKVLQLVGDPAPFGYTTMAPDGARVAVTVSSNAGTLGSALWMLETERGVLNRFAADLGADTSPAWSPDGQTVLFGTATGLARVAASGVAEPEHIYSKPPRRLNPTDWSRSGTVLFNQFDADTEMNIMMLPVTPDGKPLGDATPYIRRSGAQSWAHFSPDGGWVAYEESAESGNSEVFIDTFPERHRAIQISTNGGFGARWNPQGGELFYRSPNSKLMAVSLKMDKNSAVPSSPRELFTMPTSALASNGSRYDVGPDGQRFLIQVPVKKAPLNVIVNWQALLRK